MGTQTEKKKKKKKKKTGHQSRVLHLYEAPYINTEMVVFKQSKGEVGLSCKVQMAVTSLRSGVVSSLQGGALH